MTARKTSPLRVGVISLGCAKNLVDTEVMLGHLDRAGCTMVQDPSEADVIIVNTCGFIGPARKESIDTILDVAEYKKEGALKRLVVAGCMVQRYAAELKDSLPEVDAFIGLDELDQIAAKVLSDECLVLSTPEPTAPSLIAQNSTLITQNSVLRTQPSTLDTQNSVLRSSYLYDHQTPRRTSTAPWTAYIKIAEGCDHTCSFCAIPNFRGTFRSRRPESVVAEARSLAEKGVVEINLIAQDSSHYGRDIGDFDGLPHLLEGLNEVDGLRWIRVHYLYPNTITDRVIEAMASLPKVVPYVDMPLQHAHPEMLKRMRRGGSSERHLELLDRFRVAMPEAALRTTLIVGFPGETDEEFAELESFVRDARFDHLGVFTYSHEEGTGAYDFEDDVAEEIKEQRRDRLMALQQEIALDRLETRVGETVEVLVEGTHADTDLLLVGRMATQAIEVDGQVLINDGVARPGMFVDVELTEVAGYDLVGHIVGADI